MAENTRTMNREEAIIQLGMSVMGWDYEFYPFDDEATSCFIDPHTKKCIYFEGQWNPFTSHADAHQLVERVGELGKGPNFMAYFHVVMGIPPTTARMGFATQFAMIQASPHARTTAVCRMEGITVQEQEHDSVH